MRHSDIWLLPRLDTLARTGLVKTLHARSLDTELNRGDAFFGRFVPRLDQKCYRSRQGNTLASSNLPDLSIHG